MERIVNWLAWLCRREVHEIGRKGLPRFLTRWVLWGTRFPTRPRHLVFLHLFHRGDSEAYFHDHPWPFWSLILWGGYYEHAPYLGDDPDHVHASTVRTWYGPGSLLSRPAEWRHRVEIPEGKRCWTLVWCGPKERSWGFWCPGLGFVPWRDHQKNQDAGGPGCE